MVRKKIFIVAGDYNLFMEHDISFVADIDNHNEMDFFDNIVSIEAVPAEGFSVTTQDLYKLNNGKPEKIADIFIIPH